MEELAEDRILICELSKPRSPILGNVYIDSDDDWFITIEFKRRKSGEVTDRHLIIQKDLSGWLSYLKSLNGWETKIVNEELVNRFDYKINI